MSLLIYDDLGDEVIASHPRCNGPADLGVCCWRKEVDSMATTAAAQTRDKAVEGSLRWGSWLMGIAAVGFIGGAPVLGLAVALPAHYPNHFDTLGHLGLIYLATVIFVAGALLALRGIVAQHRS
jgi:hypothetical protein